MKANNSPIISKELSQTGVREPGCPTFIRLVTSEESARGKYPSSQSGFSAQAISSVQFRSVQLLNRVWLFVTPWTAACQASLSITNSQSLFKLMSIESVMPSNHLILCRPLLLLPSIFPCIRVFPNESSFRNCILKWDSYQSVLGSQKSFRWLQSQKAFRGPFWILNIVSFLSAL